MAPSLPIKSNTICSTATPENNGVLAFCQQEGIILTAYSPLKSDVMEHPVVKRIAADHNVTPAQIAIQWLVRQPAVITIPKSSDIDHAQENLDALDLNSAMPKSPTLTPSPISS